VTGRQGAARHQAQGLAVFALGLALTSGSLALLHTITATPAPVTRMSPPGARSGGEAGVEAAAMGNTAAVCPHRKETT
jgi:hypothetical protein